MSGDFLSVGEAAAALGVSEITVKRYIYAGRLGSAKLPGGRHRIPRAEVDRLLVGGMPQPPATEEVVEGLEARVTELEAALEQVEAGLRVVATWCAEQHPEAATLRAEISLPTHRISVLGPGCRRCRELYERTTELLQEARPGRCLVEQVTDLERIAEYGPVLTPALAIDGRLVWSGQLPRAARLRELLREHLS